MPVPEVKALLFDVFGTVVDWRSSVAREAAAFGRAKGIERDWLAFADAWRAGYQPAMEEVRSSGRPWVILDQLHREILERVLLAFEIDGLTAAEVDELNLAWHRLDPWPDAVAGLTRLKGHFTIGTLSNGNIALMVDMAKRAGLPWDVILGAEVAGHYKPEPAAYLNSVAKLALAPAQVMLVAAHNGDLRAAAALGMRTGFVARPTEHGPGQTTDLRAEADWDVVAADFGDLAGKLGA